MIAGTLEVQLLANMARLASDMKQAKETVTSSMQAIERSADLAKKALGALGLGLSINFLVGMAKGAIDAMDRLNDLSKTTRITVEDLAGLKLAAKQTGSDLDSVAQSISKLSVNIGKDPEKYRALGVSAKDPLKAFQQLAEIFVALEDPQQRAAVMATALGKSWQGAAPLLSEGAKGIQAIVDKGKALSGMTKESAERADEFNDRMAEFTFATDAAKKSLVVGLLPAMTNIATAMTTAAQEGGLLLGIWVGLGGAMAHLLGLTEAQKTAKRLLEIAEELESARKRLQSGSTNPQGSNSHFFSFLVPDIKVGEEQLAKLRERIKQLEEERARLSPAKDDQWQKDFDAQNRRLANLKVKSRADAFLGIGQEQNDAYKALLKSINEHISLQQAELDGHQKLTEGQKFALKVMIDLRDGKHQYNNEQKRFLAGALEELLAIDKEIQKRREQIEVNKAWVESAKAMTAEQERMDAVVANAATSQSQSLQDLEFEIEMVQKESALNGAALLLREDELRLMSQVNYERDLANALRKVELDLQRDLLALGPETNEGYEAAAQKLRDLAAAQREALPGLLSARETAKLSNELSRESVSDFKNLWSTVESTGKQAFVHLLSEGRSSFASIGKAIKASVIDLLYQLTVRKWIINIGASLSGSFASGAASAAGTSIFGGGGGGGGGFGGIGNLFSSVSNPFSGAFQGSGFMGGLFNPGVSTSAAAGFDMALGGLGGGAAGEALLAGGAELAGGAFAGIGAALPYVGGALAIASMLGAFDDDGGESRPGYRNTLTLTLLKTGPGQYQASTPGELIDPAGEGAAMNAFAKRLSNPFEFNPAVLDQFVGRTISGPPGSQVQSILSQFEQMLAPAASSSSQTFAAVIDSAKQFQGALASSGYLSPVDQLSGSQSNFASLLERAKGGDAAAAAQLGSSGSQYLAIARSAYASGEGFQAVLREVTGGLNEVVLKNQESFEAMFRETPAAIQTGFSDQVKALREGFTSVVEELRKLSSSMRQAGVAA